MKTKEAIYEAVIDALVDLVPEGQMSVLDQAGEPFEGAVGLAADADLAADLGPGTLTYQGIESSEPISWDLDTVRVVQRGTKVLLTGDVAEIQ